MLVFDVNVEQSFDRLRFWREQFIFHANVESVEDFPFIVIANKTDMPVTERAVSRESLIEFARSNGNLPFVETSAKTCAGVSEAFETLVSRILLNKHRTELQPTHDHLQELDLPVSKSPCC